MPLHKIKSRLPLFKKRTDFSDWKIQCNNIRQKLIFSNANDFVVSDHGFDLVKELFFNVYFFNRLSSLHQVSAIHVEQEDKDLFIYTGKLCNSLYQKFNREEYFQEEYLRIKHFIIRRCEDINPLLYLFVKKKFREAGTLNVSPAAFVKNAAIRIDPGYFFNNSPFAINEEQERFLTKKKGSDKDQPGQVHEKKLFIGRESIKELFLTFLKSCGTSKKGVFLVTGYRGMGKTSFVNQVINDYQASRKDKEPLVIPISISLAQTQPSEIDILRLMVSHVYDKRGKINGYLKAEKKIRRRDKWSKLLILFGLAGIVFFFGCKYFVSHNIQLSVPATQPTASEKKRVEQPSKTTTSQAPPGDKAPIGIFIPIGKKAYNILYFSTPLSLAAIVIGLMLLLVRSYKSRGKLSVHERLELLYKRIYAVVRTEQLNESDLTIEQFGAKLSGASQKEVINYPMASTKEIEYELIEFLSHEDVSKYVEFIFILDELDKIESPAISTNYVDDSNLAGNNQGAYLQQMRGRKQAIINIIAGLKNFLTTAPARFIFIAGREMFDATLADVSDRQSSIGSIFNYVFYIESFLKESINNNLNSKVSLGSLIEKYMKMILFGKTGFDNDRQSLYEQVYEECFEHKLKNAQREDENIKANNDGFADFIKALDWEPKDLEDEMAKYVTDLQFQYMKTMVLLQNYINYLTYRSNGSPKKIIKTVHEFIRVSKPDYSKDSLLVIEPRAELTDKTDVPYLYFSFNDQYRIGFLNHLYRPFIVKNGETFKKYSDNIIISTTYLFDHLLKFHPFAFSFSSLEMIPEVLSTSKTPSLRNHIQVIIDYLSNNHLRETEIGIFDYKFYSRTVNELVFLSKIFEEESAAFNFTLDEAYLIKLHIRRELESLRKDFGGNLQMSFSATHLSGMLGDLHFFDQEYDAAIVSYSNAISSIKADISTMTLTNFVVMVRYKLKLGLTFEKIKNYDEALSFYADAVENAKEFIMQRRNQGRYLNAAEANGTDKTLYHTSVLSDLLQIVNQAFIAKIVLQEKLGIEGIANLKFGIAMGGFLSLSKKVAEVCGRSYMINANLYLVIGNLLYFKNSNKGFGIEKLKEQNELTKFIEAFDERELKKFFYLRGSLAHLDEDKKRLPLLALCFYVIGLTEVISSRREQKDSLDYLFYRKEDELTKTFGKYDEEEFPQINGYELSKNRNLAMDIITYLKSDQDDHTPTLSKSHNKYIAMFLSHIGDCLLGMINKLEKFSITEIFDLRQPIEDKDIHLFPAYLRKNEPAIKWEPAITDVLLCYYWAAQFFKKRGRMVSYSFQLRKILYTLRLVLKDNFELSHLETSKPLPVQATGYVYRFGQQATYRSRRQATPHQYRRQATSYRNRRQATPYQFGRQATLYRQATDRLESAKILEKIEETILNPILEVASETSEYSDRYLVKKYDEIFQPLFDKEKNIQAYAAFVKNNLANHPDSREAISLFLHIKLKVQPFDENEFEKYKYFVNPYNMYATQYTRIFELAFWGKMNKIKFYHYIQELKFGTGFDTKICEQLAKQHPDSNTNKVFSCAKEYLFSLFSIIHILDIYGLDYMVSHTFKAYVHRHIGDFLSKYPSFANKVIETIRGRFGYHIQGSLSDPYYHYAMAKTHYEKAIQVHTVGPEYLKYMDNIIYLEDDINDNAYHFGAAMDRFLLFNDILETMRSKCESNLANKGNHLDDYLENIA